LGFFFGAPQKGVPSAEGKGFGIPEEAGSLFSPTGLRSEGGKGGGKNVPFSLRGGKGGEAVSRHMGGFLRFDAGKRE